MSNRIKECKSLKRSFEEYCASTSIHGVQYLSGKNLPLGDRLCWLVLLSIGFVINATLISNELYKWRNSQVIITYNDTFTPVWEIPFPTVTICTDNKYHKNLTTLFKKNETNDENELEIIEAAMLMTQFWGPLERISNFKNDSFLDKMKWVAPSMTSVILQCIWRGYGLRSCTQNEFKSVFTDGGLCFTFNSLKPSEIYNSDIERSEPGVKYNRSNWSLESGYSSSDFSNSYPYRGGGTLEIILLGRKNFVDNWTRNSYDGFDILLNNPAEVPQSKDRFISIPPNSDVIVSVKPDMIIASNNIHEKYLPEERHCYYPSERPLAFFKTYVQRNCKLECLTNYTLMQCNCVHFYMPRKEQTNICGSAKEKCVRMAAEQLQMYSMMNNSGDLCNCLPDCNYLHYNYEVTEASSDWPGLLKVLDPDFNNPGDYLSSVTIAFYSDMFIAKYRKETYMFSDFIANCGGLLGLFSGFSALSFFEMMYHILRFFRNKNVHTKYIHEKDNVFHMA